MPRRSPSKPRTYDLGKRPTGWCIEGRHEGTKPKHSKPCANPSGLCSCSCHR